jgi:hypothetical protein
VDGRLVDEVPPGARAQQVEPAAHDREGDRDARVPCEPGERPEAAPRDRFGDDEEQRPQESDGPFGEHAEAHGGPSQRNAQRLAIGRRIFEARLPPKREVVNANAAMVMSHEHHWAFWKNSTPVSAINAPP